MQGPRSDHDALGEKRLGPIFPPGARKVQFSLLSKRVWDAGRQRRSDAPNMQTTRLSGYPVKSGLSARRGRMLRRRGTPNSPASRGHGIGKNCSSTGLGHGRLHPPAPTRQQRISTLFSLCPQTEFSLNVLVLSGRWAGELIENGC